MSLRCFVSKDVEVKVNLEKAIQIAVEAHAGDVDKGGSPYILHPLRVMLSLQSEDEMIVGVLHDVVEDSDWSFEDLARQGFSEVILEALKSVTKTSGTESYADFISRAKSNAIGRKVKIADITDNLDITRLDTVTEKDVARLIKYKSALVDLNKPT